MVRPHLEYAAHVWCPNKISDIKLLEEVQRRITKCIHELNKLPYEIEESESDNPRNYKISG